MFEILNVDNDTKNRIILDLCGGTGAWSKPYQDAGYDVRVITLPKYDVRCYRPPDNTYGVLAAPPCTEFSLAKGAGDRDFYKGMETVEACLGIIWKIRYRRKLAFWAIENPVGFLRQFLGMPAWTFEQWQFGEMQIKRTDLWGYFKTPKPTVKKKPEVELTKRYPNGKTNSRCWAKPKAPTQYQHYNLSRQAIRAITPAGFAKAFFKANP